MPEDPLRLRLDFHEESVVLRDFAREGVTGVRLVSALDIAHALARELDLTSGLLPPDALWWARTGGGERLAVWRPLATWTVRLRERFGERPRRFRLPMPGLVFVCPAGSQAPWAFATPERPRKSADQLFRCPTMNVFPDGRVCTGTHAFPADPARVPEAFFESYFSRAEPGGKSRRHPDDVGRLWEEIDGQDAFPLDDLVAQCTVADAMQIGT